MPANSAARTASTPTIARTPKNGMVSTSPKRWPTTATAKRTTENAPSPRAMRAAREERRSHSPAIAPAEGRLSRRQLIVLELLAQRRLLDLAGRGMRDFIDEGDVVRQPPLGDLALYEGKQLLARGLLAVLRHNDEQGALVPFGMAHTDDGRLGDIRVADGQVFQIDGGDPLAAGLDDVLGAVGDLHVAVAVDMRDVARVEPALLVEALLAGAAVIGIRDSGAANLEPAEGLAVPGPLVALVVRHLHLDAKGREALLLLDIKAGIAFKIGVFRLHGAESA